MSPDRYTGVGAGLDRCQDTTQLSSEPGRPVTGGGQPADTVAVLPRATARTRQTDVVTFMLVGGRLSLDFVGTLTERRHEPGEQLSEPERLSDWARAAGIVDAPVEVTPAELGYAVAFRESLYRVLTASSGEHQLRAADIAALNRAARYAPVVLTLGWSGSLRRRGDVQAVIATVVRDALELLGGDQANRVRECDRPECTRLYLDTSRTRNRRWCDMAECGNRAKVAAFRRRQHGWAERGDALWAGHSAGVTSILDLD